MIEPEIVRIAELNWLSMTIYRPVERGEGGKVFPGPTTFGGPCRRSKILKMVFRVDSF